MDLGCEFGMFSSFLLHREHHSLMREAEKMLQVRDEYILNIYGVCIKPDNGLFGIVLPYMAHGSLDRLVEGTLPVLVETAAVCLVVLHLHQWVIEVETPVNCAGLRQGRLKVQDIHVILTILMLTVRYFDNYEIIIWHCTGSSIRCMQTVLLMVMVAMLIVIFSAFSTVCCTMTILIYHGLCEYASCIRLHEA